MLCIIIPLIGLILPTINALSQDVKFMYENDVPAKLGSYNSLRKQVAFCKMQGYETVSRTTSSGPSVFLSGLVKIGVGLSSAQFGGHDDHSWLSLPEGAASCGMCIEVTNITNMPYINDELTQWNYDSKIQTPFIAMVFDQCTDPICESGYLDFDVYDEHQPVENGNPYNIEWRAIDCPVGDVHKLEYLFCVPGTCNAQDPEDSNVLFHSKFNEDWWAMVVRNQRIPLIKVEVMNPSTKAFHNLLFVTGAGWVWQGLTYEVSKTDHFEIRLTSADGQVITEIIPNILVLNATPSYGYRGGVLITGKQQFAPSHF